MPPCSRGEWETTSICGICWMIWLRALILGEERIWMERAFSPPPNSQPLYKSLGFLLLEYSCFQVGFPLLRFYVAAGLTVIQIHVPFQPPHLFSPSKPPRRTFLVAQWIRICLPVQGMWVGSLVQEDSTCRKATKLVCCKYWSPSAQTPCCSKGSHWGDTAVRSLCTPRSSLY